MTQFSPLLAAQGHASPPLIDVDWTLLVQLAVFLLLYAALSRLVFAPYLAMRREQRESIEGARTAAERDVQHAQEQLATCERLVNEAKAAAAAGRADRRAEGNSAAQEQLAHARRHAEAKIQAARTNIAASVPAATLALRTRADQLARAVVAKVLGREF